MVKPKEKPVEINKNSIDSMNQNNTIPNNNKITGSPDKMIQEQAQPNKTNQNTQQAVKLEDIDPMLIQNMKNLQEFCMQSSFKYMDISSNFKGISDAVGSWMQLLEAKQQQIQKMMQEHNKRNSQ